MLKLDVAFLYDLLGASQEHKIKPKKFAQTDIDEVIIGHTNEAEYRKLLNNEFMEALRDRTIKIDVPYNLRVGDERRIYERTFGRGERGVQAEVLERGEGDAHGAGRGQRIGQRGAPSARRPVPRRRMRKLHIGLFGYSRSIGGISLPRAISFCAASRGTTR